MASKLKKEQETIGNYSTGKNEKERGDSAREERGVSSM